MLKSNPIQFQLNGQESYNEEEIPGVFTKCFHQVFDCERDISIYYLDQDVTIDEDFSSGFDKFDNFLSENYTQTIWTASGGLAISDAGSADDVLTTSLIKSDSTLKPGNYSVTIRAKNNAYGSSDIQLKAFTVGESFPFPEFDVTLTGDSDTFADDDTFYVRTYSFSITTELSIGFAFVPTGTPVSYGNNIEVDYINITSTDYDIDIKDESGSVLQSDTFKGLYTFNPSDIAGFTCGDSISIEIRTVTNTLTSDLIRIIDTSTEDLICRIEYSNNNTFDGIPYGQSPSIQFELFVSAQFWKETAIEEFEDIEESQNTFVRTYNELADKKRLELDYMPNYMHSKIRRILMHDNITIDGDSWIKQDEYEQENVSRYGLSMASTWLTQKDSITRNVI